MSFISPFPGLGYVTQKGIPVALVAHEVGVLSQLLKVFDLSE